MTPQALTLKDAWLAYDDLYHDPRVVFADEPEVIEPLWRLHTQHKSFSPKLWNDAYLAAFAVAGDLTVVTFDKGFAQFAGLAYRILKPIEG
jgi:predicted nucleic acid-binding protein